MKKYKCIFYILIAFLGFFNSAFAFEDGIRIAWNYQSRKNVSGGVYSRIKRLSNGDLAFVYSDGPEVWIRKSKDKGNTWSDRVMVSRQDSYGNTNAEMIQLQNGWLLYAWNGRPLKNGTVPFNIKIKISKDLGATWVDEKLLYNADVTFANGCWEPAMLQLPSGEIQLFFANENPYRNNGDQEITMLRSFDNGNTWTNPIATSYRAGGRDGMPVPVYLKNNKGIVYAIEDPGFNGNFKPVIISTSVQDNWSSGLVPGNSPKRWGALRQDYALAGPVYAGAPYLIQLPTGETVLCFQNGLGRTNETPVMQVFIGDDNARNFSRPSTPLHLAPGGNGLWNALEVIDENTIIATSSVGGTNNNGLYAIQGKVIRPLSSYTGSISIDGQVSGNEWATPSSAFIGSYSNTNATIKTSHDAGFLYLSFEVKDENLNADSDLPWDDDGVEVYLDPKNKNCNGVCEGMYKFLFNIGNKTLHSKAGATGWADWHPTGIQHKVKINGTVNSNLDKDNGYNVEIAIPWSQLGGKPALNTGWGIHFKLHDDANGAGAESNEDLSGNDPNKASTYMRIDLKAEENGQGLTGNYFQGKNFETPAFSRLDANIQFDWGLGSPDNRLQNDGFSVRWTGQILAKYSELYTFHIKSDNGRRLWIDNKLIIDKWLDDWDIDYTGQVALEAGRKYNVKLEYYESSGGANIQFQWNSPSQLLQAVPRAQLYPESILTGFDQSIFITEPELFTAYPNPATEVITVSSDFHAEALTLVDMHGLKVYESVEKFTGSKIIPVKSFERGLYCLLVKQGGNEKKLKIILQ